MTDLFSNRFHLFIMGTLALGVFLALTFALFMFESVRTEIVAAMLTEFGTIIGFFFGQRATRRIND